MKTSSAGRDLDRNTAWGWLTTNLLVLPGLGTLLAGEKFRGVLQMILALAGFSLTLYWLVSNVLLIIEVRILILQGGGPLRAGLIGLGVFFCAWVWSLGSGLRLVRRIKQTENED